jgi:type II secretory pathway predicted ATPase ExeA
MKFLAHFGLKHLPFHKSNTVLWDNQSLSELQTKFNRLLELPGIGILTGEFGLGKTIALRKIAGGINPHIYHVVYIAETCFSRSEFYRILAKKLEAEVTYRRSDLWFNIREKLVDLKHNRKILPVIIIDEAQSLPHDFFIDLCSFLNFNYDSEDMLTLWLVGNKHFLHKIKQSRHDSLKSRIRIFHHLRQIESFEEFKSFIEFGFTEAGCKTRLLSDASLRILKDATKSAPRQIYNAITNCLEVAYEKKLNHIPDELLENVLSNML